MTWRRVLILGSVFFVGLGIGAGVLRAMVARPVSGPEAQRRALAALERPPLSPDIGENKIVSAVKRIEPAVVNIDTVGRGNDDGESGVAFTLNHEVRGKGSGVVLTSDGYIVTNNHVIDGARRIRVTRPDGTWYYAKLIGQDLQTDLAVVKVEASGLAVAELGDSDALQVGEWSVAVGNPLGLGSTVTVGVISALNRRNLQIEEGRYLDGAIQTDAAINRGNSGGALANINGQLVGINTAILSSGPNGGSIGLGFALPINTVRRIAHDLIATGRTTIKPPRKPWLGVQYRALTPDAALALKLSPDRGVEIKRALPSGPASLAGVRDGDILLAIDGKPIGDERDVSEAVQQRRVGERALLHLLRPGEKRELDVTVTVQERPQTLPSVP